MSYKNTEAIYHAQLSTFFPDSKVWEENEVRQYVQPTVAYLRKGPENVKIENGPQEFKRVEELSHYLESIRKSKFVKKHFPETYNSRKITYYLPDDDLAPDGQKLDGGAMTNVLYRTITLARTGFGNTKQSAIHEFSHIIDFDISPLGQMSNDDPSGGHGQAFARINIMLVTEFLGKELGETLEKYIRQYGGKIANVEDIRKLLPRARFTLEDFLRQFDERAA